jgi:hypothetical protein
MYSTEIRWRNVSDVYRYIYVYVSMCMYLCICLYIYIYVCVSSLAELRTILMKSDEEMFLMYTGIITNKYLCKCINLCMLCVYVYIMMSGLSSLIELRTILMKSDEEMFLMYTGIFH